MISARGGQRIGFRHWAILAVVLVVSFLGHDVLMAAAPSDVAALDRAVTSSPWGTASAPRHGHDAPPDHPENCRLTRSAVPRGEDGVGPLAPVVVSAPGVTDADAASGAFAGVFSWEEPRWPPGRLRALLQVYRI